MSEVKYEFVGVDKSLSKTIDNVNKSLEAMDKNIANVGTDLSTSFQKGARGQGQFQTATRKTNTQLSEQSRLMSQISNQLTTFFSIYAAERFISQLVKVRGEFELQAVALSAMLQNKKLADDLFAQVQEQALESPFKILELNKYLKQLKAYRIENEELIPTLKQLGDISAGLGVSLDRLILAYGQVRAASVLRGQELRQFTEAGIPLVAALADKFSELENRVVGTDEIFEKISNRQVSFEMIKEIFADMTSESGIFFDQQKKQANTLSGQVSILADAYDKMLNNLGKANEDNLKGAIGIARDLVDNYKVVLSTLKALVVTYGAYRTALIAVGVSQRISEYGSLAKAIKNLDIVQKALNTTLLKNPYVAVATAITAIVAAISVFVKKQKDQREALINSVQPLREQSLALGELSNAYRDVEDSEENRVSLLNELRQINPELVDSYQEQNKAIKEITASLENQEKILRQVASLKILDATDIGFQEARDALKNAEDDFDKLALNIEKNYTDIYNNVKNLEGAIPDDDFGLLKGILESDLEYSEKIIQIQVELNTKIRELQVKRSGYLQRNQRQEAAAIKDQIDTLVNILAPLDDRGFFEKIFKGSSYYEFFQKEAELDKAEAYLDDKTAAIRQKINEAAKAFFPDNEEAQYQFIQTALDAFGLLEEKVEEIAEKIPEEWKAMNNKIKGVDFELGGVLQPTDSEEYLDYIRTIQKQWQQAKTDLELFKSENIDLTEKLEQTGALRSEQENAVYQSLLDQKNELEATEESLKLILEYWNAIPEAKKRGSAVDPLKDQKDQLKYLEEVRKFYLQVKDISKDTEFGAEPFLKIDVDKIFGGKPAYEQAIENFTDEAFRGVLEGLLQEVLTVGGKGAEAFAQQLRDKITDIDEKTLLDAKRLVAELEKEFDALDPDAFQPFGEGAELSVSKIISTTLSGIDDVDRKRQEAQDKINSLQDGDEKTYAQKRLDNLAKYFEATKRGLTDSAQQQINDLAKATFDEQLGQQGVLDLFKDINNATLSDLKRIKEGLDTIEPPEFSDQLVAGLEEAGLSTDDLIELFNELIKKSEGINNEKIFDKIIEKSKILSSEIANLANALSNIDNNIISSISSGLAELAGGLGGVIDIISQIQKDEFTSIDLFSSIAGGVADLTNIIINSYNERKRAQEEFYLSGIAFQNEYNLSVIRGIRLQESQIDSIFVDDWQNRLQSGLEAADAASDSLDDILQKLSQGQVVIDVDEAIDWQNVGKAAASGAAIGAAIGGGVVGGVVGAVAGGLIGLFGGKKTEEVFGDLLTTYPELIDANGELNTELAESLIATDKLDAETSEMLSTAIELTNEYEAALEQVREVVSGFSGDLGNVLRDSLVDAFVNGTDAALTFKDALEQVLEQIIATKIFNAVFGQLFKDLETDLTAALTTDTNEDDIAVLSKFFENSLDRQAQFDDLLTQAQELGDQYDFDLFRADQTDKGLSKGIQSITEDTANIIAAYLNTIRHEVILQSGYLTNVVSILQVNQVTMSQQLGELAEIKNNTLRIANVLESVQAGTSTLSVA